MHWFYYIGRVITWLLLMLFARWQVHGRENVPPGGPLLIVANHISLADPPVIGLSIRRRMQFMAKEELFRARYTSYFIRHYGTFPVKRRGLNRRTLELAEAWLAAGNALVMFPEGGRSPDNRLQPAFPGTALLAGKLGAPILPVGITGTEVVTGLGKWMLRRPVIRLNIGPVFTLPDKKPDRDDLQHYTNIIMEHIAALLPAERRGSYTGKTS
ncbi:MAG: lysophospholipid acyltransferase family protein [Chloroflexota bacterium]